MTYALRKPSANCDNTRRQQPSGHLKKAVTADKSGERHFCKISGQPQQEKTVLLTRGAGLNEEDGRFFDQRGFHSVTVPLTAIEPLAFSEETKTAIRHAQWLIFTSQAPVAAVLQQAAPGVKVAVIGAKTAAAVSAAGFAVDLVSPRETKKALVEELKARLPQGAKVVYPKSQLADAYLEVHLAEQLQVYSFTAYRNVFPKSSRAQIMRLLNEQQVTAVYLTSPSAWRRFRKIWEQARTVAKDELLLIAIGETTLAAIRLDGYDGTLKSDQQVLDHQK